MKVDMSPKAIENRLKLVGELTKACLLLRRYGFSKEQGKGLPSSMQNNSGNSTKRRAK